MIKLKLAVMATCACVAATGAQAQFARPGQAIKYRKSAMYVMNIHFTRIMAVAEGKVPLDPRQMTDNALLVEGISKLPWQAFGPGTDKGEETNAKPEVWKEAAKFKAASEALMNETAKLAVAARTGNLDAIKAAAAATAKSCKSCHDYFVDE